MAMTENEYYVSSWSSLPATFSRAHEDGDEMDEILIFEEDGDDNDVLPVALHINEEYDYGMGFPEDLPHGYSLKEMEQKVIFVRSSKDTSTGDFAKEHKSLLWCIENGYEEVQAGVWSGSWYFTYLFGEEEGRRAWLEARNKRLVKESGGRARHIPSDDYRAMLHQKEKGKRSFFRGQFKSALDSYKKAEELMGGDISGIYLVPFQRTEMVTILSNQAECYLRLKKYEDAIIQATKALQLDRRHNKSLLRRAKATIDMFTNGETTDVFGALEDLQTLIDIKGEGSDEAQILLESIRRDLSVTTGG